MYYSEIREIDLKLPEKSGNYQGISFHELAGNPVIVIIVIISLFHVDKGLKISVSKVFNRGYTDEGMLIKVNRTYSCTLRYESVSKPLKIDEKWSLRKTA